MNNEWVDYEGEFAGKDLRDIPTPFLEWIFANVKLRVDNDMLRAIDNELRYRKNER